MLCLSPWAAAAIVCTSLLATTHATHQCSNRHAGPITVQNGGFASGQLAPWEQYSQPNIPNITIVSPGYHSRYAAKIVLPSVNFNEYPDEYNYTTVSIVQQIYTPVEANACYKVTMAYNFVSYTGPGYGSPQLCNFVFDASALGYTSHEPSHQSGWHEDVFYATSRSGETQWDVQADLDCLPVNETNTTPEVVLLIDHVTIETLRHPPPPGTPIQQA